MNIPPGINLLLLSKMKSRVIWSILLIFLAFPAGGGAAEADSTMAEDGYIIGPEDVLHISVWKEEELEREVVVRPDGKISFPLAGDVQAAGRTTAAVQQEITERLSKYISDPVATVSVKTVSGYKVYVLGKVNNPGEFMVGRYIDVLQALTLAGGLNPYASKNNIKILRRDKDGKEIVLPFKYGQVKSGKNLEQNIMLRNGDVIVVP